MNSYFKSQPTANKTGFTDRLIALWLMSGLILILTILIIGGITRLTQSGLSIVEWRPITGIIPPLRESTWATEFDKYRESPEYQYINKGMTLNQFKRIYYWEYIHRMVARVTALVFLIPFIWFTSRRLFTRKQFLQASSLFLLALLQAFIGWFMVQSGLSETPFVSPYRLSIHLMMAFALFGCCLWFWLDASKTYQCRRKTDRSMRLPDRTSIFLITATGILLVIQVFWGGLVAGLKAGYMFNTFPLMNGSFLPQVVWQSGYPLSYWLENPASVQWVHRWTGVAFLLLVSIKTSVLYSQNHPAISAAYGLLCLTLFQVTLGILTLILVMPIWLAVTHQAVALLLFGQYLWLVYLIRNPECQSPFMFIYQKSVRQ